MKDEHKKLVKKGLALLGILALFPFALGCCDTYVCNAEGEQTPQQILDETRYTKLTNGQFVSTIIDVVDSTISGELPAEVNAVMQGMAKVAQQAIETNGKLVDYANASTGKSYQIQDSWSFVAKRRIVYPYDGLPSETDYLFCYVDKNTTTYTPQSFGDVYVSPNSCFIIRDTSWMGMKYYSFSLTNNNITARTGSSGDGVFDFILETPTNDEFVIEYPDGNETFQFSGLRRNANNACPVYVTNNTVNDINSTFLSNLYATDQSYYDSFFKDSTTGEYRFLTDLEVIFGSGYRNGYYEKLAKWTTAPWYLTSGYGNIRYPNAHNYSIQRKTSNNINQTVDPALPPFYLVPNDSPFHSGQTLNETTVNNYNDYGITYNDVSGEFELSPDVLAGALAGAIDPDFNGLFGGVFDAQPDIGLDFGTPDLPLNNNYVDIIDELLNSLVPAEPSTRPLVPAVTTFSGVDLVPTFSTGTFPPLVEQGTGNLLSWSTSLYETLGVIGVFLILAVIGCVVYMLF